MHQNRCVAGVLRFDLMQLREGSDPCVIHKVMHIVNSIQTASKSVFSLNRQDGSELLDDPLNGDWIPIDGILDPGCGVVWTLAAWLFGGICQEGTPRVCDGTLSYCTMERVHCGRTFLFLFTSEDICAAVCCSACGVFGVVSG